MESVVSKEFFNGIKAQDPDSCEGKSFYTRNTFLTAVRFYPGFAHGGTEVEGKREIAAFFANVAHETGSKSIHYNLAACMHGFTASYLNFT